MKIITPVAIIFGILIGFVGQSLLSRNRPRPDNDIKKPAVEQFAAATVQLRNENEKLRKRIETLKAAAQAEENKPEVKVAVIGDNPAEILNVEALREQFLQQQHTQSEKRINLKLATLADHLSLSEDQRRQVRKLMVAQAAAKREKFSRIFNIAGEQASGQDALEIVNDVLTAGGQKNTFDNDLNALLDGDQKESYATYQAKQRANMTEARANQDLAALQSMFELSSGQKDQAFDAFAALAREDLEGGNEADGILNAERMIQQRERRLSALDPILTDEQMALYRDSPAASASTFMNFGNDLDGATIIGTSITIDAPLKIQPAEKQD
jgi:hypothetical protein